MKKDILHKFWSLLLCGTLIFIMTACPYSSTVPIDNPTIKVSDRLLGKWTENSEFNDNPDYFIFRIKDELRYILEEYAYDSEVETYTKNNEYVGHVTILGNMEFFNLWKEDEGKYYFYRLEYLNTDEFIMHEVTDNITEEFYNSNELKAFFNKNKDLSFFYNRDAKRYYR
jgi:hypothetical protein